MYIKHIWTDLIEWTTESAKDLLEMFNGDRRKRYKIMYIKHIWTDIIE